MNYKKELRRVGEYRRNEGWFFQDGQGPGDGGYFIGENEKDAIEALMEMDLKEEMLEQD